MIAEGVLMMLRAAHPRRGVLSTADAASLAGRVTACLAGEQARYYARRGEFESSR